MPGPIDKEAEPLRFLDLPAELIRNIASLATVPTVLGLTATCHALRAICKDHFIFQEHIERHRSTWDEDTFAIKALAGRCGTDTVLWAQYALADEKANGLNGGLDTDLPTPEFELMTRWMPHLIVYNHPFTSSSWLALRLSAIVHSRQTSLSGVFCYAAAMLSTNDDGNDMVATATDAPRKLKSDILKIGRQWRTFRAIGSFAVLLRQDIRAGRVMMSTLHGFPAAIGFHATSLPVPRPPSTVDIPFVPADGEYELPVPFKDLDYSNGDNETWSWYYWLPRSIGTMCKPGYLDSGKWTGYFLDPRSGQTEFHPMHDIQFTVIQEISSGFVVHGTGWDSLSHFTLEGTVTREGELSASKTYPGAHSWDWFMVFTPLGLYGVWGAYPPGIRASRTMEKMGALYLWKEEWTRGRREISATT